jgi:hypothetical protein
MIRQDGIEVGEWYRGREFAYTTNADGDYSARPVDEWLEATYPERTRNALAHVRVVVRESGSSSRKYWLARCGRHEGHGETRNAAVYMAYAEYVRRTMRTRVLPLEYSNGTLTWPDETWQERHARQQREEVTA